MDQAGDLRERVTIQSAETTPDSQGGRSTTWSTLATVWARIVPMSTAERLQVASIGSQVTYQVEVPYRADVTAKMRLQWTPYRSSTTKTFEIHGATPKDGRFTRLLLDCGEVV